MKKPTIMAGNRKRKGLGWTSREVPNLNSIRNILPERGRKDLMNHQGVLLLKQISWKVGDLSLCVLKRFRKRVSAKKHNDKKKINYSDLLRTKKDFFLSQFTVSQSARAKN